jgi:hypothetical protein|tara:strand:- start:139 stop:459 length:321 start_codon:yes stop_codon:yes gene_type:complete
MRKVISVNQHLLAKTWKLFQFSEREMSAHDLAHELEIGMVTAYRWMRTIHDHKLVHICGWRADTMGRYNTPIYAAGDLMDKPKPKRTLYDRRRAYRIKMEIARAGK